MPPNPAVALIADLTTAEGRAAMVDGVTRESGGKLDGLLAGAGISGRYNESGEPAEIAGLIGYLLSDEARYVVPTATVSSYTPRMAELVGMVAMSHAPFWDSRAFDPATGPFMAAAARARALVQHAAPSAIVAIGPDHFRNFFYDAMPPFCIGLERVTSFGDFHTPRGELATNATLARHLQRALRDEGFDAGVSLHMGVDHGIVQSYACLVPGLDVPVVPISVACTGPAMPTLARCRAFGDALGAAIRSGAAGERVVVMGSGGLSHWLPPTDPDHPAIDPAVRDFVIDGRAVAREYQRPREARLLAMAATLDGRVNAEWDRWVLERFAAANLDALASLRDDQVETDGGNGGHEIRNWLIAAAAWGEKIEVLGYQAQPAWLTGTGVAAGFTSRPL